MVNNSPQQTSLHYLTFITPPIRTLKNIITGIKPKLMYNPRARLMNDYVACYYCVEDDRHAKEDKSQPLQLLQIPARHVHNLSQPVHFQ